jgi:hypothetical protein
MSKKSSKNGRDAAASTPVKTKKVSKPIVVGAVVVALIGIGLVALRRAPEPSASSASTSEAVSPEAAIQAALAKEPSATDPEVIAKVEAQAKFGPHKQAKLPPIPFQGYAPPRSYEIVTAAYQFAAEHPEILSYVPCFCGCQHSGHTGNESCFVKSRAENGDVVEWDEHGVECTICIDVANRSRQMFASGASVQDIRAAIEKTYGATATTKTPTPMPPAHAH